MNSSIRKSDYKQIIAEINSSPTIIEKVIKANEILKETDDEKLIQKVETFLMELRDYQVGLINAVKNGEELAFDKLIKVKDINNFIYHYAWHIQKYYRFQYREADVVGEIKYQIYYTIKQNYRIYNQPNEFSLLINSMRRWIKQKVGSELKDTYKPKVDEYLMVTNIEDESYDFSKTMIEEVISKILSEENKVIFELRFFEGRSYKQIGEMVGKSKDAVKRRYERILKQIEGYFGGTW